jgi:RNA-directed DNA polymerase
MITRIAADEGFRVNAAKTRVMGRGTRQNVTGVVVNAHPNVPRAEYDTLKAILHRAGHDGPAGLDPSQLLGRIAWVESLNPARGAKLRDRFAAISWTRPTKGVRPLNNSKRRVEPNSMLRGLTPGD